MRRTLTISIAVVSLGTALLVYYMRPDRLEVQDYSAFEIYRFAQRPGVTFCADSSRVFTAAIKRVSPDNYTFEATLLRPKLPQDQECSDGIATDEGCMTEQSQPPRSLTTMETKRVKETFASLSVHPNPIWECRSIGIDPCLISQHGWDQIAHDDYVCSTDRLPSEQSTSITKLLSTLGGEK